VLGKLPEFSPEYQQAAFNSTQQLGANIVAGGGVGANPGEQSQEALGLGGQIQGD